eukprot:COSAG02_NODE_1082_length_14704_cov_49.941664_6_plen_67_part_00
MGRGGKACLLLGEAQSLLLHGRLDDAVGTALTALGAPSPTTPSAWEVRCDAMRCAPQDVCAGFPTL